MIQRRAVLSYIRTARLSVLIFKTLKFLIILFDIRICQEYCRNPPCERLRVEFLLGREIGSEAITPKETENP